MPGGRVRERCSLCAQLLEGLRRVVVGVFLLGAGFVRTGTLGLGHLARAHTLHPLASGLHARLGFAALALALPPARVLCGGRGRGHPRIRGACMTPDTPSAFEVSVAHAEEGATPVVPALGVPVAAIVHEAHERTIATALERWAGQGLDKTSLEPILVYCAEQRCQAAAATCPGCRRFS